MKSQRWSTLVSVLVFALVPTKTAGAPAASSPTFTQRAR